MRSEDIDKSFYLRDVDLLRGFLRSIQKAAPKAEIIYLEGNHEERYRRIMQKYPKLFFPNGRPDFQFIRDAVPRGMKLKWIPYGTYRSSYRLGDAVFVHGTIYPEAHSKKYALDHAPFKVIYGHLHDFQSFTIRNAFVADGPGRYAVTAGCLTHRAAGWKKGMPNKWVNGFISFLYDGNVVTPTIHLIENGRFAVGAKVYQ